MLPINLGLIIVFAGVFAATRPAWLQQPLSPTKFAFGTIVVGVASLLFLPYADSGPNSPPLLWLVLVHFWFTMGELCRSLGGQSLPPTWPRRRSYPDDRAPFLSVAVGSGGARLLAPVLRPDRWEHCAAGVVGVVLQVFKRWISEPLAGVP